MIRKLLGLVFNRWVLLAVLLLALALLIWIVGPLVAIADARPLEGEDARWIAIGTIVAITAAIVAWRAWQGRRGNSAVVDRLLAAAPADADKLPENADLAGVRERFEQAMQTLRRARFGAGGLVAGWRARFDGRYLYELPWYLIIGAPGSGKTTALINAGLQFPLAHKHGPQKVIGVGGTRNCDWWFTDRAVLIDTAGRFVTHDSDRENDRATWSGFLELLKASRPRQPLNGVLVTVSAADLLAKSTAERADYAAAVRARLHELQEQLAIRFPTYLLVTKCDLVAGFMEMFATLDKDQRAAPWGMTFTLRESADGDAANARLCPEFDALTQRLDDGLIDRLQAEPDAQRRAAVYGFAGQFAGLRGALHEFTQQVFERSRFEAAPPLWRGVYFISGTQEGTPIDRVLGAIARGFRLERAVLPPQRASGKAYFLNRLLGDVVFAESGLAGTDLRWERRRTFAAWGAYAAIGVVAVGTLLLWGASYLNNRGYVAEVAERVELVRKQVQATPNRATPELAPIVRALQATRELAAARSDGSVPMSLGFGLFQGRKLDGAAHAAYQRMLVDAVLPRLALRIEEQLRSGALHDTQYEALKAYLMLYDPANFDAPALTRYVEDDWNDRLARELSVEQRAQLSAHLKALLDQGPAVSPVPADKPLIDATRTRLTSIALPQRVYQRMRQHGLGADFPEFTVARAGGPDAPLVFTRTSGKPLTQGVPGLFSYDGYHKGFQREVEKVTEQLADEQGWVLGIGREQQPRPLDALGGLSLVDQVRRLYLNEYAETWAAFIADVRVVPLQSLSESVEVSRRLSKPDGAMPKLMKAISRETTLLAGKSAIERRVDTAVDTVRKKVAGVGGKRAADIAVPEGPIENIVDARFARLRQLVFAPEGGKAPIDATIAKIGEINVLLTGIKSDAEGGAAPRASPLPNELKAIAGDSPQPLQAMLMTLVERSKELEKGQMRQTLSREVASQVGEFCQQAIAGRYPLDRNSARDATQADFTALFGPGGKIDTLMQGKLAPYVDTSTRPWRFRPIEGTPLGSDAGSLPQFHRAQAIRETFFPGGAPTLKLEFKPVDLDPGLTQFVLDVDGQVVRYAHGPQIPTAVSWPGPRGSGQVRVQITPPSPGASGMVAEGPWALFRLFERVRIEPGSVPERFRATFEIDGRKAVFDVTTSSVRNPFRLRELNEFACPTSL